MVIHIEIGKSYAGLRVRIGDCEGALELSNITAEEALKEIRQKIEEIYPACKTCNGTGSVQGTDCDSCGGKGKKVKE